MPGIKNRHYVILLLLGIVCLFVTLCTSRPDAVIRNAYGQAFAGSGSCRSCHQAIYDSFMITAHYRDSRPASAATIKGSFADGSNRFVYHPGVEVMMEHNDSGFFQTAARERKPFDIVIGSGRRGQSYLYWEDNRLFQLPVSYFTPTHSWCKSPGYTADSPVFNRRVPSQCLECHATNARTVAGGGRDYGDFFDKSQLIYGIDCERCHGPGADHIKFHRENPGVTTGVHIINAGRLSRQQQLDACALCHSGSRYPLKPAFSFRVGDKLDDFSEAKYRPENAALLDVHGNQYGLLTTSQCFIQSQLNCSTCHGVHGNEAGDVKIFSQRCMSCHNGSLHKACTMTPVAGLVLSDNCIDCHMPALPSQKIVLEVTAASDSTRNISNLVRTHRIAIYPEYTRVYLKKLKG